MARLTIERCKYDHFELVAIAAERAKQLISGAVPTVPKSNEKFPLVALREIEAGNIDKDKIRNNIIAKYQSHSTNDHLDEESPEPTSEYDTASEDYATDEHNFNNNFDDLSYEEFDNENIFSDDIMEDDDKNK